MTDEGSATLWILGLTVMVLFLGGISLDLWRAFEVRQDLAAMADSAATAGASQVDAGIFRSAGIVVLDGADAEDAAAHNLAAQQDFGRITNSSSDWFDVDEARITVSLEGEVHFTLLAVFSVGGPVTVRATGSAEAIPSP